uniref:Uncharacterized protein n=1 Tax=Brassica oleracea var. oleracea TaxID=109376 RepID=A0A0D3BEI4_BRAOL
MTKGVPIGAMDECHVTNGGHRCGRSYVGVTSKRVIGREEVATFVRKIMVEEDEEGQKVRAKAEEVRASSERARAQGGSSYRSHFEWAKQCRLVS